MLDNSFTMRVKTLETVFAAVAQELRNELLERDRSALNFVMQAKGRTSGDLNITVTINDDACYFSSGQVEGNSITETFRELIRRRGWEQRNKPLMITRYDDTPEPTAEPSPRPLGPDEITEEDFNAAFPAVVAEPEPAPPVDETGDYAHETIAIVESVPVVPR